MSTGGYSVTDIANQALDAIGWPEKLGDINDGSDHAQVLLRSYRECLKQMLRAVHWDFARRSANLQLLADASGNTVGVPTVVPNPKFVYEYAYPTDCVKARFVQWNIQNQASIVPQDNIQIPPVSGLGQQPILGGLLRPARFLIATDPNYPPPSNPIPWDQPGISPQGRTVILTNVRFAVLVYTSLMLYPSNWDPLFRAAFVAFLAADVALPIWAKKDPKMGLTMRAAQTPIVQDKVMQARIANGNEGGPSTTDIRTDWMDTRRMGGPWSRQAWGGWNDGGGDGVWGYGNDSLAVAGGAVF